VVLTAVCGPSLAAGTVLLGRGAIGAFGFGFGFGPAALDAAVDAAWEGGFACGGYTSGT